MRASGPAALLGCASWALGASFASAKPAMAQGSTVMVVPFEIQPATATWMGEYVADDIPRTLALAGLATIQRTQRMAAHDAFGLPDTALSRATAIRLAEALAADRIVVGKGELTPQGVTLEARILDVGRGSLSTPLKVSGPLENLTDLALSLAWDIALAGPSAPTLTRADVARGRVRRHFTVLRAYGEALATRDAAEKLRCLTQTVGLAPDFDAARIDLTRARLDGRDYEAALRELAPIPQTSGMKRDVDFLRAAALLGLNRFEEADRLLQSLAGAQPTAAVLANRGLAVLRSPRRTPTSPRASDLLRQANELLPGSAEITFDLAYALLVEGDVDASIFWLNGLRELDPDDNQARLVLSWALRRAGRNAEADTQWSDVVSRAPSFEAMRSPDSTRRLERILVSEQPFVLDPSRRGDTAIAAGHRDSGNRALAAGDLEAAFRELSRAAYLNPYEPEVHRALAAVHLRRGDRENAAAEMRMALWCGESIEVRVELMSVLQDLGRTDEAKAEALRILRADPNNEAARKVASSGSL